ncbi:T6SS effector BTH_I2691 family protein [Chitinivorax sp. B]|uniref:T6SS effector BTH_I2691 family protein n=1 Tax=Chitinivorax sp. B TaxID=2502235 RepID=UPI0010F53D7F|nr:T6SS effector BTH_I2691 family protein [Chitinivorax sp. B]
MKIKKDCRFCNREGFKWLPLIYGVVAAEDKNELAPLPAQLPANLGQGVTDIALHDHCRYAVRMPRQGYLYVLIERKGVKYWAAYQVVNGGYLYEFPPEWRPQLNPEFSCDPTYCGVTASMVNIPKAEDVPNIWVLFTPEQLTDAKLAEYKKHCVKYAAAGKLQVFHPAAWLAGQTKQPHALPSSDIEKTVAEFLCFGKGKPGESYRNLLDSQYFSADINAVAGKLGGISSALELYKIPGLVIHDPIGITQALNDFRNDSFVLFDQFLKRIERGRPNRDRLPVLETIGKFKKAINDGFVMDAKNSVERRDLQRRAKIEPIFPDDSAQLRKYKMWANNAYTHPSRKEWEAQRPDKVTEFELAREKDEQWLIDHAEQHGQKKWQEHYAPLLDVGKMDSFEQNLSRLSTSMAKRAAERTPHHLSWLKTNRVLQAFDCFDQRDTQSGEVLRANVIGCIFGMEGSPVAEKVLNDWAAATKIDRTNLLLRALTRDQQETNKAVNKLLAEATNSAANQTDLSAEPTAGVKAAIKSVVSMFKSTDSALDEWMRNQSQSTNYLNPKHLANYEARFSYLISTLCRAVSRKAIGSTAELAFAARISFLMQSQLGDLAFELEHKTLMAKVNATDWDNKERAYRTAEARAQATRMRKTGAEIRAHRQATAAKLQIQQGMVDLITDAQLKAKIQISQGAGRLGWKALQKQLEDSAKQHTAYDAELKVLKGKPVPTERVPTTPSPTNNYHQARIGMALIGLESIALVGKLGKLKPEFDLVALEVLGGVLSIGSAMCDMFYASVKSVRELPQYNVISGINKGADIVRGGFKLKAGAFGFGAGIISAILDIKKLASEKDSSQIGIMKIRIGANIISSVTSTIAAYSYSAPYFEYYAAKQGRKAITRWTLNALGAGAKKFAERVLLLRMVAWLGWVGVIITVADLSYSAYRWYIDSQALERWFDKCLFRKNQLAYGYANIEEELQAFEKASLVDEA